MSDLHEKVHHTIKKFDLLRAGDTVVVAVSGGADSVALLHLLRGLQDEYALALHIAHLNQDRKSTRLNSSHQIISYAVFCLKKKKKKKNKATTKQIKDSQHRKHKI